MGETLKKLLKDKRIYFMLLLTIAIVWFFYEMIKYQVLPTKMLIVVVIVLLTIAVLLGLSQYKAQSNKIRLTGKAFIIVISIILLLINIAYTRTVDLFSSLQAGEDTDIVSVIVKTGSSYQYIEDLKGHVYSALKNSDDYVYQTVDEIEELNDETIDLKYYAGIDYIVDALYDEDVDCIIINEAYRSIIEDSYETFTDDTRVIYSKTFTVEVENSKTDKDVTQDTFSIYISGIDTYGTISTKSRSDVNMIVTINPTTKQILMTSIPRDYYIPFNVLDGSRDKLTHSGLYSVSETVTNVENYFDIDIDYYVRVNFTSLVDIVDAIGGIEVDNPTAFGDFAEGTIHLDGEESLAFSRERYAFASGDRERGKNQMRVLTGIINKITSVSVLRNYADLLDSLESSFQTSLSEDEMLSLIRMQLDDMASWSIETISVDGTGDTLNSPIYGSNLYMMIPDDNTVATAKEKIMALYE
ncbi:MAG: LCP family protein [Erysipelotrichaceae bacterium]|nr:LCP family protein [Erysipelotrichaceae bacterium]